MPCSAFVETESEYIRNKFSGNGFSPLSKVMRFFGELPMASPPHRLNTEPWAGVADSVTTEPCGYSAAVVPGVMELPHPTLWFARSADKSALKIRQPQTWGRQWSGCNADLCLWHRHAIAQTGVRERVFCIQFYSATSFVFIALRAAFHSAATVAAGWNGEWKQAHKFSSNWLWIHPSGWMLHRDCRVNLHLPAFKNRPTEGSSLQCNNWTMWVFVFVEFVAIFLPSPLPNSCIISEWFWSSKPSTIIDFGESNKIDWVDFVTIYIASPSFKYRAFIWYCTFVSIKLFFV